MSMPMVYVRGADVVCSRCGTWTKATAEAAHEERQEHVAWHRRREDIGNFVASFVVLLVILGVLLAVTR